MAVLKDLLVHGRSQFINGIQTNQIEANTIKADSGIFNQLIATSLEAKDAHISDLTANNATVYGVMDVKGKMQTNNWEAANIANVGGNFYISPTGKASTGTVTITRTTAASGSAAAQYSVAVAGTFGVGTTSGNIWKNGAYAMVTGNVAVGNRKYPLGTCDGEISNIGIGSDSSNPTITGFTINNVVSSALDIIFAENSSIVTNNGLGVKDGFDLQVSVYLGKNESNYMPVGILLTSYGKNNKQYIDIYDGTHSAGTSRTGFAEPVVRIGDLSGISPYSHVINEETKYTITPQGWGIYTTQGYFRGEVYSELGYIGGWTIDASSLHNPPARTVWNVDSTGIWIAADVIAGGPQMGYDEIVDEEETPRFIETDPQWYIKADGSVKFGELTYINGTLTVPAANVVGQLGAAYIHGSQITANSITANQIDTENLSASNSLSIGAFTPDDQYLISNEYIFNINEVSSNVVQITEDKDYQIRELIVDIEPVQTGSGDPSPSNIRPITNKTNINTYISTTQSTNDATIYNVLISDVATVFKGTIDIVDGILTVTHGCIVLNGSENWTYSLLNDKNTFNMTLTGAQLPSNTNAGGYEGFCDTFNIKTNFSTSNITYNSAYISAYSLTSIRPSLLIAYEGATTVEDFQTWLNSNNVTVIYPLAEPLTYHINPRQIPILSQTHYIWSDTGDVIVKYATGLSGLLDTFTDLDEAAIDAANQAKYFITADSSGITIHPQYDNNNKLKITDQIEIIRDNKTVATYGENITIGDADHFHITLSNQALEFYGAQGDERIAYVNGQDLYVQHGLGFGNFIFRQRENNHFTLTLRSSMIN